MAQTPANYVQEGSAFDYTPVSAVTAGDVIVLGTIPYIAKRDIAANSLGALAAEGVFDVPKSDDEFAAGDSVYWDPDGNPVTGTAGSGCADTSASGNVLMGVAILAAASGASYVRTRLSAIERTATVAGSVTADDITGGDSTLTITGVAGAGGSAGGTVPIVGGAGHTNGAGGAAGITGGAGAGTGAGGAVNLTGGASGTGATGNGGAGSLTGGAALSTNGTGGAVSATGGVGKGSGAGGAASLTAGAGGASGTGAGGAVTITAGASGTGATGNGGAITITAGAAASTNGNGGSVTIAPGALSGTGAPGKIHLNGFVAGWKAQAIAMNDAAVTLTRVPGTPSGTLLTGNLLLVDPESGGGAEVLKLPPEADMIDSLLIIKCTGGEHITLQDDAAGGIGTIEDGEAAIVHCDGTNWSIIQFVETT